MSLERRLQVLIDEERHQRIVKVARERGVSMSAVVREALDRGLLDPQSRRRAAGERLLEAADMAVPEPPDLRAELEELRGRRG
jgi:Zn-dependent peptidase ImmA (M78 family)